jgi:pimeloyl-ACP methyl ester carboxylesterase
VEGHADPRGAPGVEGVGVERGASFPLASGAEGRLTGGLGRYAVVLVNGGQSAEAPGTWSATLEWLVTRVAPRLPELGFLEVRYRVKSWRRLDLCAEDAVAALEHLRERGVERSALVGFSMGGAVSVLAAAHESVRTVVGLAPWLPERLPLDSLAGKRLAIVHGGLDRGVGWIPGVTASSSRAAFERARRDGVSDAAYTLVPRGVHGTALRAPWGLVPLPRARRFADLLTRELERFAASG